MSYDMTYCLNDTCEATDCKRHYSRIPKGAPAVSMANFDCSYEPVKGHWIVRHKGLAGDWVDCSECATIGSARWKACPVCGARMEVQE